MCVCVCGYLHNYKSLSSRRVAKNKERKKKKQRQSMSELKYGQRMRQIARTR